MNKFFIYKDGDLVTKTYTVTNKTTAQTGAKVNFVLPQGVSIQKITVSRGSYDNLIWTIGNIAALEIISATVIYVVNNVNLSPFDIKVNVLSNEGGLFCDNHIYLERTDSPCVGCDKVYPIFPAFSADNGSYTARTLSFKDTNISFSTLFSSGSSAIYARYQQPSIYGGSTYVSLGDLSFIDSNGISFGISGSTLTASHNGITTQYSQVVSASNSSLNFQTLQFGNTNGLSHYISNGSILISSNQNSLSFIGNTTGLSSSNTYNNLAISAIGLSAGLSSNTLILSNVQTSLIFSNSNGITFGTNGSTLTASHNGITTQFDQAASGSNGSYNFQTLQFGNLNGLSFYTSNSSIVGSYSLPGGVSPFTVQVSDSTYTNSVGFVNSNGISFMSGAGGIVASINPYISTASNANGVTLGVAGGVLTASVNAGNNYISTVSNSNGVTLGVAGSVLTASISQSNQTIGLYALGNTTNNTTATVDARSLSIVGYGNLKIGYSNQSLQISDAGGFTVSNYPTLPRDNQFLGYSTNYMSVTPIHLPNALVYKEIKILSSHANLTGTNMGFGAGSDFANSNADASQSVIYGIYSKNVSTLSLMSSYSFVLNMSLTGDGTDADMAGRVTYGYSTNTYAVSSSESHVPYNGAVFNQITGLNYLNFASSSSSSIAAGLYYGILKVNSYTGYSGLQSISNFSFGHVLNTSQHNEMNLFMTANQNNYNNGLVLNTASSMPATIHITNVLTTNVNYFPNIIFLNR